MFANTIDVLIIIPKARNRSEANSNTCSCEFKSPEIIKFVEKNQMNHKRFGRFQREDAISQSD